MNFVIEHWALTLLLLGKSLQVNSIPWEEREKSKDKNRRRRRRRVSVCVFGRGGIGSCVDSKNIQTSIPSSQKSRGRPFKGLRVQGKLSHSHNLSHPSIASPQGDLQRRVWLQGGGVGGGSYVLGRWQGWGLGLILEMITYVHCLSVDPAVSCLDRACYEDPLGKQRTLCSFKPSSNMGNSLQAPASRSPRPAKPEGCLRKRLLSVSKVHQKQDSLWTPKPLLGPQGSPGKTQTRPDGKGTK